MFLGHIALGLAAKRATPRLSLGLLVIAAQLADLLWPFLLVLGVEYVLIDPGNTALTPLDFVSYPWSHSLLLLAVWGVVLGGLCWWRTGDRRAWLVLSLLVVSHWVLDWITHRPDMPLYPGSATYGLGLWNSIPGTLAVEFGMFAGGLAIYLRTTRPKDAIGRWGIVGLVAVLVASYLANVMGGPPPSLTALYGGAIAGMVLLVVWSWWADRHRRTV